MNDGNSVITYDAFARHCPSVTVLDVLANKWTILVLCALRCETRRFGELSRQIGGVTPKVLTQTLRVLERDGLLVRTIFPEIPPRVEYQLTPLGKELINLCDGIRSWAETHVPEIQKARAEFERRDAAA
jgi:DNA-binding HxlR family transcriptional regulator